MLSENIGDLESQEKGTGARFNSGKPDWSLLPLNQVAFLLAEDDGDVIDHVALIELVADASTFQIHGDANSAWWLLDHSFKYLKNDLDTDFNGAMTEVIRVWEYGQEEYAPFNWMKGMSWSAVLACYMRHIMCLQQGEILDKESGRHHGAHVVCNAMMLVHFIQHYKEGNDLPCRWFQ
jgi:hypothetical protein